MRTQCKLGLWPLFDDGPWEVWCRIAEVLMTRPDTPRHRTSYGRVMEDSTDSDESAAAFSAPLQMEGGPRAGHGV